VEFRTVEHREAVKAPAAPGAPAAPQSAEDVDQLKSQVDALRLQLQELQKKRAAGARSDPLSAGVPWMAVGSSAFARGKEELAPVNEPNPETPKAVEAPLMPTAGEMKEAARRVVGMALPMEKNEERGARKDPAEELLPKPELDFSKMPGGEPASVTFPSGSLRPPRTVHIRKVMTPLLAVMGVGLTCGAWYGKVWTYLSFGNPPTVAVGPAGSGKPSTVAPTAGAVGATPGGSRTPASAAGNLGSLSETAPSAGPEKKLSAAASTEGGLEGSANEAAGETGAFAERTAEPAAKKAAAKGKDQSASSGKVEFAGTAPDVAGADSPVLPAKLLKAANPVYPPNAMRSFITGDVKVEAVVGADGRVGEVKVLSGPRPLREAAVEALKRYKYAPATQGGKAVTSKVTETVKFWFNP
jgi:TonB family protein